MAWDSGDVDAEVNGSRGVAESDILSCTNY